MIAVKDVKLSNIFESMKKLKGNTRTSVFCEPLWGIPFVIFNFYLSLYMKEIGVTDRQVGYLISIGAITGALFSMFAGSITDRMGRKKTTLIFDLISWPLTVVLYLVSNSFWVFAIATITNSVSKIVAVSWNLMIVEDADNDERVAAFNLINIINISTGVIIPLAGIIVRMCGLLISEKIFLGFAAVSMTTMILLRNHFYTETKMGRQIIDDHSKNPIKNNLSNILSIKSISVLKNNPIALITVCVFILFNIYIPIGTINSLYFTRYITDVTMLDKSTISILGGIYSAVMFIVFVFINPIIGKANKTLNMVIGLVIQAVSLALLILVPTGNLAMVILCITLFAVGFGVFRPFIDSLLAEVTEGKDRAGIYSIVNTITCIMTVVIGLVAGDIYVFNPRMLYFVSIVILITCAFLLAWIYKRKEIISIHKL